VGAEKHDIFDKKVQELEATANKRAESFVLKSMDISLLGGGWAFLLEFSTVIVIILTLLIIGIAGVVTDKEITTILASVAGHVLVRATAEWAGDGGAKSGGQPATAADQRRRGAEPVTPDRAVKREASDWSPGASWRGCLSEAIAAVRVQRQFMLRQFMFNDET
jgi:hypothetical protein